MTDLAAAPPPTLGEMFITSVNTLDGAEIDLRVTPGWNDRPPLLLEKGNWRKRDRPEDPALLKGVSKTLYYINYVSASPGRGDSVLRAFSYFSPGVLYSSFIGALLTRVLYKLYLNNMQICSFQSSSDDPKRHSSRPPVCCVALECYCIGASSSTASVQPGISNLGQSPRLGLGLPKFASTHAIQS